MNTFLIALSFLILSATRGCSADAETGNTTMNENKNCSNSQLREAVQEFNRNGNWTPVRTRLEAALNNSDSTYSLLQLTPFPPLHFIIFTGNTQLVSLLLCNGLDVNQDFIVGRGMLHIAADYSNLQIVKFLLDHGADVNARDGTGDTPLHLAATRSNLDIVKALVQAGANTTITSNSGHTALNVAWIFFNSRVSGYLMQFPHYLSVGEENFCNLRLMICFPYLSHEDMYFRDFTDDLTTVYSLVASSS